MQAKKTTKSPKPKTAGHTVLVTGADRFWGRQVALALAAEPGCGRLVLLSDDWTGLRPRKAKLVRMDTRDLEIEQLLRREKVHTVFHLDYAETYDRNEEVFDRNVIGTLTLLSACAVAGVKKVIIRSSQAVYGANHNNPHFLTERRALRAKPYLPWARDLSEMERYIADARAQNPEMCVTLLRFAHVVGAHCDSPMMRYVKLARAPVLMGFEPLYQVIHESDAIGALLQAFRVDIPGPVNVTPDGVLPLMKLLRLAKRRTLPVFHPIAYAAVEWARNFAPVRAMPLEVNHLRYHCMGDNRRMKEELGFAPTFDVDEAFAKAMQETRGGRSEGRGRDADDAPESEF